jgi:hypothetical protein
LDKKKTRDLTTLQPIREETSKKRTGLSFTPGLFYKIASVMKRYDIEMVPKATGKLSQVLGSAKDAVDDKAKSYKIQCETCPALYIGQTKRHIQERFKEHTVWARKPEGEMTSSVAKHLIANPSHSITSENLSLEKSVQRPYHLDAWESIFIQKNINKHLLNEGMGNVVSSLINIF